MSKTILITINNSGNDPGPYDLTLIDGLGNETIWSGNPVTKAQLTSGYIMTVPDNIVKVKVQSKGCTIYSELTIPTTQCPCQKFNFTNGTYSFYQCGDTQPTNLTLGSLSLTYCVDIAKPVTKIAGAGNYTNTQECCSAGFTPIITPTTTSTTTTTTVSPSARLSVLDFGAVGDGENDDTQAIKDTIEAAIDLNILNVYFPAGTYIVTTGFNLPDNITISGDGESSLLKLNKQTYLTDFATQGAMFMGRPSYGNGDINDGFYGPNSSKTTLGITIRDLAIDIQKDQTNFNGGYPVPPIPAGGYRAPMVLGIRFYNPVNCLVDNVKIIQPWGGGIQFKTTIDGTESKNNIIRNSTIIMQEWYYTPGGIIDYDVPLPHPVEPNAGSLIGIELTSYCNYTTNNGAGCYDRAGSPSPPYVCDDPAKIQRNLVDGSYTPSRTYNNTITNCTILNGSHCISLSNASNNTITNNTIVNGSNRGIITSSRSDNNIFSNNNISLCGSTGVLLGYNANGNTVSYNTISTMRCCEGQGIGANILATNNIIEYNTVTGAPQAGIRVTHGPSGNIIRHNTIIGTDNSDINQMGVSLLANWLKYYCLDAARYGDQLMATNNTIYSNGISNVNVGVYMGDEKNFGGRLSGNIVTANIYTDVATNENLNVTSYKGSTTTYEGNPCAS